MKRHLSLRLPEELWEKLNDCAKEMSITVSDIARFLIAQHADELKEKMQLLREK